MSKNNIDKIEFVKYKRFENQTIQFKPGVNAIAGTNGTCKSSLLHIISNSYKDCTVNSLKDNEKKCISIIRSLLSSTNPKIESLNRKDLNKNDPAPGIKGHYYTVKYEDGTITPFRRHNSKNVNEKRYRVIPAYKRGSGEKLKEAMIAYLGINRLFPFGEFSNDNEVSKIKQNLPSSYKQEIIKIFKSLTAYKINIDSVFAQKMGLIKNRINFITDKDGIDSNTISAGEDNLLILITALVSLRYFKDSIKDDLDIPAILLIDELDATLHPDFQIKLINTFIEYANKYGIQFFFTTHSITLLKHMITRKSNIIYILDNVTNIKIMENISIEKIENFLENSTERAKYKGKKIPLYTEDAEARVFLKSLLDNCNIPNFDNVRSYFHLVNGSFGCENLKTIFLQDEVTKESIKAIGILDGDQNLEETNFKIMTLPGNTNPEILIFKYIIELFERDDEISEAFWENTRNEFDFTKHYFNTNVLSKLNDLIELHDSNNNARGMNKDEFNINIEIYKIAFTTWCNDPANQEEINIFFSSLHRIFKKLYYYFNIKNDIWTV